MNWLDTQINDIEPRLKSIFVYSPEMEESSLQESLAAYGWVLLDSWITWRTLRYLLRDVSLDNLIGAKWVKTPSSYTGSQLMSVWQFNSKVRDYIQISTGKSVVGLINTEVQKNRNACAHFSSETEIKGSDWTRIQAIFKTFSPVFTFYEVASFINTIASNLKMRGFSNISLSYDNDTYMDSNSFLDSFDDYLNNKILYLSIVNDKGREQIIAFDEHGCRIGMKGLGSEESVPVKILTSDNKEYKLWNNKGYYQDTNHLLSEIVKCYDGSIAT